MSVSHRVRAAWKIYLDDFSDTKIFGRAAVPQLLGLATDSQGRLRTLYGTETIPRGEEKAITGALATEHLGYVLDGDLATLGISIERELELISIGFGLLSREPATLLDFQTFAGKLAHALQARRPLWSLLSFFWRVFKGPEQSWIPRRLVPAARSEVLGLMALMPLAFSCMRGRLDSVVTVSDASERGLGVSRSVRLSPAGQKFVDIVRPKFGSDLAPAPSGVGVAPRLHRPRSRTGGVEVSLPGPFAWPEARRLL